jgi:hypothetical protein
MKNSATGVPITLSDCGWSAASPRCSVPMTSPGKALGLSRWSGPVLTGRPAAGYGEIPATYVIGKGVGDSCNGTG